MITAVRFPFAVPVVRLECHIEWTPGKREVRSIEWAERVRGLLFQMDVGSRRWVIPPPGSIIDEAFEAPIVPRPVKEPANNGPASSPPPARALPAPSSRKGR